MISRFWNSFGTQSNQAATVCEGLLAPFCVYDAQGKTLYTSQKFLDLLQITVEQVTPKPLYLDDFVHPDDRWLDLDLKQRLIQADINHYTIEKRLMTQTQDIIWVNLTVSRLEGADFKSARQACFVALLEDITDQRRLHDALIRTEEKWKTFVLNSPHLFLQISDLGSILYMSPAVERTLGYQEAEILDRPILDFIHPHDWNEFRYSFYQWINGHPSLDSDLECRWRTKSGGWSHFYMHGQRFPLALGIEGIAMTGCNISDRKQLETALAISHRTLKSLMTGQPGKC
jgi:two-component system NtrC family sensor kinase